jgi:CxxC motif-containing protein
MLAIGVALVGALSVGAAPAAAVIPTGNLLTNSGAEDGPFSADGSSSVAIPGWITVEGHPTVVRYGTAGGFPTSTNPAAGNQFFAGGANAADSGSGQGTAAISQSVDITGARSDVSAGNVQMTLTGCLGGYADQGDFGRLELTATTPGTDVTYAKTVDGPGAVARGNKTELLPVALPTVQVPPNTSALHVTVLLIRTSGAGPYDDGYGDNFQLVLSPVGTTAPAPPTCSAATSLGGAPGTGSGAQGANPNKSTSASGTNPAAGISRVGTRVTIKGTNALVTLRCTLHDSSCKGTLRLAATGLPKAHKSTIAKRAKATRLGSAKLTIAAGKTKTIKVKLSRSIRKRLAKLPAKRLKKLKITATAKIGSRATKFSLGAVRKH